MMSTPTSSGVNAASTIASEQHFIMNKRRRDLLKACRRARLKQRDILRNTSQIVHTKFGIEDHAETYFTLEGEYGGKTFLQRIEASMKAMVSFKYIAIRVWLYDFDERFIDIMVDRKERQGCWNK